MRVVTKGRVVIASEWQAWREQGLSNNQIADMLGITPSMARIIARKFRASGVPDPQYRRTKPGPVRQVDTGTDAGAYILGILWALASRMGDEGYWIRHQNGWYIDTVREHLGITASGHNSYSHTGGQTRLKIARNADAETVRGLLEQHGWTDRNAQVRPYPMGKLDDRGFIRAWVEIHSSADIARVGRKRKERPRLRIYGNRALLQEMNLVLARATGTEPRSLQKTPNEITKALYYVGRSYRAVVEWLYAGAELSNPEAREKILSNLEPWD